MRWMHNVSGSSVTWQGQSWQLLQTSSTNLAVLESIPQLLALLTAVHVVALELISREEVGQAVEERDIRSVEPAGNPVPHPTAPSLALTAHTAHRLRGGDGQGQVLDKLHDDFKLDFFTKHLECLGCFGHCVTCEALHTRDQSPVKDVGDDRSVSTHTVLLQLRESHACISSAPLRGSCATADLALLRLRW